MSLFCFLWIPLFYLFWRSVSRHTAAKEVWAFIFGSIIVFVQLFFGPFIEPGGFGFQRWLSGCVDIVVIPAFLPLFVYFCLVKFRLDQETANYVKFALVWLLPGAIIRSIFWSTQNDPVLLIIVPLLWTAIAVGVPFFISLTQDGRLSVVISSCLGILATPAMAASSYWALFSNRNLWGVLLFLAAIAPMVVSVTLCWRSQER